ncbi:uncharacterized protein LOC142338710 [Convolutriloba macropyga]|uniref:uncharacterized protein LOC142338710 n=1 Tax=Convolutriloba macropyga TaxID=536237 RepID=UPI003F520CA6
MSCESGRYSCCDCKESYPEESIFKCETCQMEQDTNSDNQSSTDHCYCDTCILSHCKKGHKILDSVSQPVLICHQHKMLLNDYCCDCDSLLCLKCMREEHNSHKLAQIEERAKEIRMNVFEQLTKFENMEKPARKQKELVLETTKANREKLEKAIKAFEKTQKNLLSELDDADEKSEIAVESILEKQNELRGLLSLSCQNLVHKWKYIENPPNEDNLMGKLGGESSLSEDCCMQGLVMKLSNNWFDCLGLNLSCIATDVEAEQKTFTDTCEGELYVVVMKNDSLELTRHSIDNKKTEYEFELVGTIKESKLSSSIESIKAASWERIILFMSDDSILEANFKKKCITRCEIPAGRELLHPYFRGYSSPKLEWIYWENGHVKSTQNDNFKIEFKTKPKVFYIENCILPNVFFSEACVLLDEGTMLITVVNPMTKILTQIPQSVHGCNSIHFIDSFSFYENAYPLYTYILLWSVKMKSITLIRLKGGVRGNFNSEVEGRVYWTDELEIKHYQTKCWFRNDRVVNLYFLPAVEVNVSSTDNAASAQSKTCKRAFMSSGDIIKLDSDDDSD